MPVTSARAALRIAAAATLLAVPAFAGSAQAATASDPDATFLPTSAVAAHTPHEAWDAWLSDNHVANGLNASPDGTGFRYFSYSEAAVADGPPERFISRRNIAFDKAMLQVKSELSRMVATDIESGQFLRTVERNGDAAPPMLQEAAKPLSIMEKARTLTDKKLDDELRRYDPAWDGSGLTPEQRQQRVVQMEESYSSNLSTRSALFVSGAMPAGVFEGMGSGGQYTVGVGTVWSPKMQLNAQALIDPSVQLPRTQATTSVSEQIRAKQAANPDFLATANGLAIWRNELGEPTVLAFVGVDAVGSTMLIESKSRDLATRMIQTFVGEQVVSTSGMNQQLAEQTLAGGKVETFDASAYQAMIKTTAPKQTISGLGVAYQWEGIDPVSKGRIAVRVFAWTPSSRAAAGRLGAAADAQKKAVQNQGVPVSPDVAQGTSSGGLQGGPLRQGQTTDQSEF